jgi:hypothetical protein
MRYSRLLKLGNQSTNNQNSSAADDTAADNDDDHNGDPLPMQFGESGGPEVLHKIQDAYTIACGLGYPGVGPEHAWLQLLRRSVPSSLSHSSTLVSAYLLYLFFVLHSIFVAYALRACHIQSCIGIKLCLV